LQAHPGAMNVIPGSATMSVDVRAKSDEVRNAAYCAVIGAAHDIAKVRGVRISVEKVIDIAACPCSEAIAQQIASAVTAEGIAVHRMPSGAGHDGMAMSRLTAFGMLFVRCKDGISHSPQESVEIDDVRVAADILFRFVSDFKVNG